MARARIDYDVQLARGATDEVSTDSYCDSDSRHNVAHCRRPAQEKEDPGGGASAGEHSGGQQPAVQPSYIRFDCAQAGNALEPAGRSQVIRNRDELGGGQDIERFRGNRAGSTSKSNYPRTGGISFAAKISGGNDAVSGAYRPSRGSET